MTEPLIETINRKYMKGTHKAMRPVDASSMVLLDRRGAEPRILMGKRNPASKFMPGFFVFPGGRLEKSDATVHHSGSLSSADMIRLSQFVTRPSTRRLKALALGAIRETFEETGFRLSVAATGPLPEKIDPNWTEFFHGGHIPTLDGVLFFARAITPPGRPRRFDTRFFVVDVTEIADLSTVRPTPESELVELRWVSLADAEKLESAEITQIILSELKRLVLADFAEDAPRPLFRARNAKFQRISL